MRHIWKSFDFDVLAKDAMCDLLPKWPEITRNNHASSSNVEQHHCLKSKVDNANHGIPSQGAKIDLEIWPHDPKSIGLLLSS